MGAQIFLFGKSLIQSWLIWNSFVIHIDWNFQPSCLGLLSTQFIGMYPTLRPKIFGTSISLSFFNIIKNSLVKGAKGSCVEKVEEALT